MIHAYIEAPNHQQLIDDGIFKASFPVIDEFHITESDDGMTYIDVTDGEDLFPQIELELHVFLGTDSV